MTRTLLALILFTLPLAADVKMKTRMTVSGNSMDSTSLVKGARQRTEMALGPGMTSSVIYQCDLKRMITLNERNKTYMVTRLDDDGDNTIETKPADKSSRPSRPARAGGVITFTTNATDTGERKKLFGYTARRIKTEMRSEASGETCSTSQGAFEMRSDGWYIDLPNHLACSTSGKAAMGLRPPDSSGCRDTMRFKQVGNAKLGYPVAVETTMISDGRSTSMKQEALDLSTAALDAALFDIPAGYREVTTYNELMGLGSVSDMMRTAGAASATGREAATRPSRVPRSTGRLRIGLVKFGNTAGQKLSPEDLRQQLVTQLAEVDVEGVALEVEADATLETAQAAAKEKECNYLLYTDVASGKAPSGKKKIGGFLARATGADSSASLGNHEIGLQYRLYGVGGPELKAEAKAESVEGATADESAANALKKEVEGVLLEVKKDQIKKKLKKD